MISRELAKNSIMYALRGVFDDTRYIVFYLHEPNYQIGTVEYLKDVNGTLINLCTLDINASIETLRNLWIKNTVNGLLVPMDDFAISLLNIKYDG